jgi:hypothetical protein
LHPATVTQRCKYSCVSHWIENHMNPLCSWVFRRGINGASPDNCHQYIYIQLIMIHFRTKIYNHIFNKYACTYFEYCGDKISVSKIMGHLGHWKMLELVSQLYWWPQMSCYIGTYYKTCDLCLCTKEGRHVPLRELQCPLLCGR